MSFVTFVSGLLSHEYCGNSNTNESLDVTLACSDEQMKAPQSFKFILKIQTTNYREISLSLQKSFCTNILLHFFNILHEHLPFKLLLVMLNHT